MTSFSHSDAILARVPNYKEFGEKVLIVCYKGSIEVIACLTLHTALSRYCRVAIFIPTSTLAPPLFGGSLREQID